MIKHTKINLDIDVKPYVREKNGHFYVVLIYKNVGGIRREKWLPTKLAVRGNKMKAKSIAEQFLMDFEIPDDDLYLVKSKQVKEDIVPTIEQPKVSELICKIPEQVLANATLDELTPEQVQNLTFARYLELYVPCSVHKKRQKAN